MAKATGVGMTSFNVDDSAGTPRNIINDINSVSWSMPRGVQDVTGLDKSARETLLLLADFSGTMNGTYNNAANQSHAVFKDIPSTSVSRTVAIVVNGTTLTVETNLTDYPITRPATGELTWAVPMILANGTAPAWT